LKRTLTKKVGVLEVSIAAESCCVVGYRISDSCVASSTADRDEKTIADREQRRVLRKIKTDLIVKGLPPGDGKHQ